jgi:4-amino-4-deoxy-L-arabinose transferase-like glycosyltransferase
MSAPARVGERGTLVALALACATSALLAWIATRSSLWDRDEPRFAQATVEMLASRDWLVPTFNGAWRLDKPALVYWLMSVPMRVFGADAWSARLCSAIALGAASLATFAAARRMYGARCGWWSQVFLALAPLALVEGSLATTDATLLACLTGAFAVWVHALLDGVRARHVIALAVCAGAAQLAKGPVALALVAASCGLSLVLVRRGPFAVRRLAWSAALACVLGTLVFLTWALPANAATQGEFLRRGIGHHVLERATSPLESHGASFFVALPYYVPVVLLGCAPASVFLYAAWRRWRTRHSVAGALLLAWSAPCFVLMTLAATKLPHYVLPLLPALAIAAARVVTSPSESERRASRIGAVSALLAYGALAGGLVAAPELCGLPELRAPAWSAAALFALGLAGALPALWRGDARRAASWTCGAHGLAFGVLAAAAVPVFDAARPGPELARAVRAAAPPEVRVARFGYVEPSLDFALARPPLRTLADEAALRAWLAEPGAEVLVVPRVRLERAGIARLPERVRESAVVRGIDVSHGRALEIVVLARAAH